MQNEKLLQRVKNLLNITTESGASEGEALNAFAAAQKLISRHHLDIADINKISKEKVVITHIVIFPTGKSRIMWKEKILVTLVNVNNCYCVVRDRKPTNHTIFGPEENLKIIQDLYDLICSQVEYFSKEYPGKGKAQFNEFKLGCATRINQRLRESNQQTKKEYLLEKGETEETSTALVFLNAQLVEIEKFGKNHFNGNVTKLKQRVPNIKTSAYADGIKQGNKVILTKNKMLTD